MSEPWSAAQLDEESRVGIAADAAWIADELWRMSAPRTHEQRVRFYHAVMNLVVVSQHAQEQRRPGPKRTEPAR